MNALDQDYIHRSSIIQILRKYKNKLIPVLLYEFRKQAMLKYRHSLEWKYKILQQSTQTHKFYRWSGMKFSKGFIIVEQQTNTYCHSKISKIQLQTEGLFAHFIGGLLVKSRHKYVRCVWRGDDTMLSDFTGTWRLTLLPSSSRNGDRPYFGQVARDF